MAKPVFSISFCAHRNHLYRTFYDSLLKNTTTPFEVIFVGDQPPSESMPENFKYIYSKVKPAQCIEIAVRSSVGDYLLPFSDDMTFSDNFLDRLYNYTLRIDMDKVLIAFRYSIDGAIRDEWSVYNINDHTSPVIGLSPVFRRDIWNKLGGVDNRFVGSFPDTDIQMRFFEYGMNIFITPDCIITEEKPVNMSTLYRKSGRHGRRLLNSLWVGKDGVVSKNRLSLVQPFSDKDILTKTQGEIQGDGKKGKFLWT